MKHPESHVVADGQYESKAGLRQRYRCTPTVGNPHRFSVLVVDGEQAVVPAWSPPPACQDHPGSKVVRAGTWVEAFAPVVYEPVDDRLRAAAYGERTRLDEMQANGEVLERPQVVLVDDVPVYGRDLDDRSKKARRDAGFFILALAETHWETEGPAARLRLVRAMAKSNTPARRLVFDELGYDPDYVVADAGTGIIAAVEAHFDPARTKFVPSMWHLDQRIGTALADTRGAHTAGPAEILGLSRCADATSEPQSPRPHRDAVL